VTGDAGRNAARRVALSDDPPTALERAGAAGATGGAYGGCCAAKCAAISRR
jgi:hypothetical protein